MRTIRTDLAIESHEYYTGDGKNTPPGIDVQTEEKDGISVSRVRITTREGELSINKPMGTYITIEAQGIKDGNTKVHDETAALLGTEVEALLNTAGVKEMDEVLVIGLGNWNITPDALGPKAISKLIVTRHLFEYMPQSVAEGYRPVCALSPGVLGITGIETGEIVKGIVEKTTPRAVIAIDALASRKTGRVGTTIQIADTGISPGSGVGNNRKSLDKDSLGIPVIAIGVPTVVDAATIADDALDAAIDNMKQSTQNNKTLYEVLNNLSNEDRYSLIHNSLGDGLQSMIVTPKEIDELINNISFVVSDGLNMALHKAITPENIKQFLQ